MVNATSTVSYFLAKYHPYKAKNERLGKNNSEGRNNCENLQSFPPIITLDRTSPFDCEARNNYL